MTTIRSCGQIILTLVLLLTSVGFHAATMAQEATPAAAIDATSDVIVDFPRGIDVSASLVLPEDMEPSRIEFIYRPIFDQTLHMVDVPRTSLEQTTAGLNVSAHLDLQTDFVPSGIDLVYFWRVATADNRVFDSSQETMSWVDTRFEWKVVETPSIRVHSYSLGDSFAQSVAETAQATVTSLEQRFGLDQSETISIWIYGTSSDFQLAQQANSREAVAGVSYPGDYVVHAVLREGDTREVGRTITHEVSHQVLFQATRNPLALPPLWFDEGMATHAQTSGIDGYLPVAIHAARAETLFRLDSLTQGFPFLPSEASIAYAQCWSSIQFIIEMWGDEGIARLIQHFSDGSPSDAALQEALGVSSDEFDQGLRDWLLDHE